MGAAPDPLLAIPFLLHFTDTRNLPMIRERGGIYSTARLREMEVQFYPGGNDWSREQDVRFGMDRYVHLCFRGGHPMAHLAVERGDIQAVKYLRINRTILNEAGVLFAPDVANAVWLQTCAVVDARDRNMIDYAVLYTWMDWRDPQIQARRRAAERCEILVPDHIPIGYIENLPND